MMKTRIFSSLIAVLLLNLCLSKTFAQDEKVYSPVGLEKQPSYPGGMQKFYDMLVTSIKYPTMAAENNVQGTVHLSFNIEKDGSLTDIKADGEKLGYGLDEEAIRVIKLSKRWYPGLDNKKPVRVKYMIPVKFSMPNKPKKAKTSDSKPSAPPPPVKPDNNDKTIYSHVSMENPPTYPGGIEHFYKFLGATMKYPQAAKDAKVEGTVYVSYTVEKDGSLADVKVEGRKLGYGLEEEAIRVIKSSKRWNPGKQNGKIVRTKYNVPVKFTMKK